MVSTWEISRPSPQNRTPAFCYFGALPSAWFHVLTCACQMQLSAHQKEFISVDPSCNLVDGAVCRLNKAAELLAGRNQSHRDTPESRSNFTLVAWSVLLTGCPTEPDSMGESSSCPAIMDVPEPCGSPKQHIFRLISFPASDSTIWKKKSGEWRPIPCPRGPGEDTRAK